MTPTFNITIVIPTHNRAHTLPRALDSVFTQTVLPQEVVVIDDGSTDQTVAVVAKHYPQVCLLQQTQNGVSKARNVGIEAATGDWIAFLDSDDSWLPDKLQQQIDALTEQTEYKICHSDEIWIRNGRRVNAKAKHRKRGGRIFQHCLPLCAISPSAALIHKSVFADVGTFDENLPACEDYDLWLRITSRYPVLYIDKPLINKFGGHSDQLSRHYWGMDRFRIQALEKLLAANQLNAADRAAALDMLLKKCAIVINGAAKRDNQALLNCYQSKQYYYKKLAENRSEATTSQ